MRNYDDIKHLTRPQYDEFPPMPVEDRAAQFSPFAALVGYDDAVAETARLTDARREISEEEIEALNKSLVRLTEIINTRPEVRVTYFIPDSRKSGGSYSSRTGFVKTYDQIRNILVFTDGEEIPVADMYSIILTDAQGQD